MSEEKKVNDGGPIYPIPSGHVVIEDYQPGVGPYTTSKIRTTTGLTKREDFAKAAMQGMLASGCQDAIEQVWIATGGTASQGLALAAVGFADDLLAALSQAKGK